MIIDDRLNTIVKVYSGAHLNCEYLWRETESVCWVSLYIAKIIGYMYMYKCISHVASWELCNLN